MHSAQSRDLQGGTVLETSSPSYRFFTNPSCEFFPCHSNSGEDVLNCLFCYCPLYTGECPGEPELRIINGHSVKDCSGCQFPHNAENYDDIIRCLMERIS